MTNLDYWQTFVGDQSPEDFMRAFGSADPELCIARFLEDRGNLYGVVNQGSWDQTFQVLDQHHILSVRVHLQSYLDETRDEWAPALEAKPPSIPRRYREKFDQDKYPPPAASGDANELGEGPTGETGVEDNTPAAEPAATTAPVKPDVATAPAEPDVATAPAEPDVTTAPAESDTADSPENVEQSEHDPADEAPQH